GEEAGDGRAEGGPVGIRQRPLRRAELERERYRLLARRDLLAAVDVENPGTVQLGPSGLGGRVDQLAGRNLLGNDDGDVEAERRGRDQGLVPEPVRAP